MSSRVGYAYVIKGKVRLCHQGKGTPMSSRVGSAYVIKGKVRLCHQG